MNLPEYVLKQAAKYKICKNCKTVCKKTHKNCRKCKKIHFRVRLIKPRVKSGR